MNTSIYITKPHSVASDAANFSWPRFAAFLRLYSYVHLRKFLLTVAAIFFITFLLFILSFYTNSLAAYAMTPFAPEFDFCWGAECSIMTTIIIIVAMIGGLRVFESLSGRQDRISMLEIPASQQEKFFALLFLGLPLIFAAAFVCFYIADIVRVIWIKSFTSFGDYAHIIPLKNLFALTTNLDGGNSTVFDIVFTYSNLILFNAIFTLGGILFSKHAALKTLFALFIISTALGLMAMFGYEVFFPDGNVGIRIDPDTRDISSSCIYATVTLAMSLFLYILSFFRLKELELIDRW